MCLFWQIPRGDMKTICTYFTYQSIVAMWRERKNMEKNYPREMCGDWRCIQSGTQQFCMVMQFDQSHRVPVCVV